MTAPLATRQLSKVYGPSRVVDAISLEFEAGSIHALLGENGAGKSTLIKMIAGVIQPTDGEVLLDGAPRTLRSVKEGQDAGVVALPQELTLVPTLDAAENIYLGVDRGGWLFRRGRLRRDAKAALDRLGQSLPEGVPVRELSAVQQTMVALARALVRDARVLILDEPTAALTDTETEQLFGVLRALREEGTAIIYVSHRLEEVFGLADTATVLRNGRHVWTRPVAEVTTTDVVAAMIGREPEALFPERVGLDGEEVLRVENLGGHTTTGVSLALRRGRVVGLAGLAGSGRSELLKLIGGAERPQSGRILLDGEDITKRSLPQRMALGVAYVPEERRSLGLVAGHDVTANIGLANLRGNSRLGVMRPKRERQAAERRVQELRIRIASLRQQIEELSGGNQQKVVLAKYLERQPKVLLLDEPTRGIDVGAKAEVYQNIRDIAASGVAVLVVSSEIPELLGVADEIAVLNQGRLTGVVDAPTADQETILHLCYGRTA